MEIEREKTKDLLYRRFLARVPVLLPLIGAGGSPLQVEAHRPNSVIVAAAAPVADSQGSAFPTGP